MSAPGGPDLYAILGVDRHADEATINASYRRLAKLKHPDKNRSNPEATAEFQDLNKAYSVLRDAGQRRHYDQLHPSVAGRHARHAHRSPATPPQDPFAMNPQSAARAAAATAAENAKTPAQRRAEADAALQANAARYAHRGPRKPPFRFVRMPNDWNNTAGGFDRANDPAREDDPATRALQDEINALRRAMQQRDASDAVLRRQQRQLAAQMDTTWAGVAQCTAALRQLDAERVALLGQAAADHWFEGLFGEVPQAAVRASQVVHASQVPPHPKTLSAEDRRRLDALHADALRLRADGARAQRALAADREKMHAVVAKLAASAARRQAQDAQLKGLAARYRAVAFQTSGGATTAPPAVSGGDDEPFDDWVAWEAPTAGTLWASDEEAASVSGAEDDGDDDGDGDGDGDGDDDCTAPQDRQWFPFNADDDDARPAATQEQKWFPFDAEARGWVPQQQAAVVDEADQADQADLVDLVNLVDATPAAPVVAKGHSDSGTNVWNYASSDERFNADLLHIESDDEGGVMVNEEEEEDDGEDGEDDDDDDDDDYDDTTTAWDLDEDICEAYTEQLKLDEDSWHAELCREW